MPSLSCSARPAALSLALAAAIPSLAQTASLDLHADWRLAPAWTLQAKLNNLADKNYETAFGYNQPGRSVYLTLRWAPR